MDSVNGIICFVAYIVIIRKANISIVAYWEKKNP